jgi:hypothetical protein
LPSIELTHHQLGENDASCISETMKDVDTCSYDPGYKLEDKSAKYRFFCWSNIENIVGIGWAREDMTVDEVTNRNLQTIGESRKKERI